MLLIDEAEAIKSLSSLLPDNTSARAEALALLRGIVDGTGEMPEEVAHRMAVVEQIFVGKADVPESGSGKIQRLRQKGPAGH